MNFTIKLIKINYEFEFLIKYISKLKNEHNGKRRIYFLS